MTVDLSKVKAGQIVHFRCGGSAKINLAQYTYQKYVCHFENDNCHYVYNNCHHVYNVNGTKSDDISPFDIIRIEDPTFDWKDVKPGMAFKDGEDIFRVIGRSPIYNELIFERQHGGLFYEGGIMFGKTRDEFIRAPEHDKVIK